MDDVIRIGVEHAPGFEGLVETFASLVRDTARSFADREQPALQLGNAVVRHWIEHELQTIAQGFGDEVEVGGQSFRRHESGTRRYHTLCGVVAVQRDTYRAVGVRNGPTVVPEPCFAHLQATRIATLRAA